MPQQLDPAMKKALSARVNYYREMGIYDFYRRPVEEGAEIAIPAAISPNSIQRKASMLHLKAPFLLQTFQQLKFLNRFKETLYKCQRPQNR